MHNTSATTQTLITRCVTLLSEACSDNLRRCSNSASLRAEESLRLPGGKAQAKVLPPTSAIR